MCSMCACVPSIAFFSEDHFEPANVCKLSHFPINYFTIRLEIQPMQSPDSEEGIRRAGRQQRTAPPQGSRRTR